MSPNTFPLSFFCLGLAISYVVCNTEVVIHDESEPAVNATPFPSAEPTPPPEMIYAGEYAVKLNAIEASEMYGTYYENCFWKYHVEEHDAAVKHMCARLHYDEWVMASEQGIRRMVPDFTRTDESIYWGNKPACVFHVHCRRSKEV